MRALSSRKRILITGGSRGIGLGTAHALAAAGHTVVLAARAPEPLAAAVEAITAAGGQAEALVMDVTDDASVEAATKRLVAGGPCDILVNNAGSCDQAGFLAQSDATRRAEMEINYWGAVRVTRALLPTMIERREGVVVNVSSLLGSIAAPTTANYSATKAALDAWSFALRAEVARFGVLVTVFVAPHTDTEMGRRVKFDGVVSLPVEYTAKELVRAIERAPRKYTASPVYRLILLLARLFPAFMEGRVGAGAMMHLEGPAGRARRAEQLPEESKGCCKPVIRDRLRVGVVGGGPAGLVAALALERYAPEHVEVVVLDRNQSETDYPGVEYGIQERACRALHRMGLKAAALRRGNPNTEIAYSVVRKGKVQGVVKTDPAWCVAVIRQEFLADLASLLQTTTVQRRTHVERMLSGTDGRVLLHCRTPEDTAATHEFDCIIAADGVQSVARKTFFPDLARAHDRGFSCIYLLIEAHGEGTPLPFERLANGGRSELFMGTFSTMTVFPMGHNRLALGIGFEHATRDRLWAEVGLAPDVAWSEIDATRKQAIALRLANDVPGPDSLFVKLLTSFVSDWNSYKIYLWAIKDSDPLPRPYVSSTNVIIVGDAAHAFMPTIGMGASIAIEDAELLASRLASVARHYADVGRTRRALVQEVFVPFARERVPVWNELMYRARWAARSNFFRQAERNRFAIAPQIPGFIPSRLVGAVEWVADRLGA